MPSVSEPRRLGVFLFMARFAIITLLVFSIAGNSWAQEFECAGYDPPAFSDGTASKPLPYMRAPEPRGPLHALVIFAKFKGESPDITTAPDYAVSLFNPNRPGSLTHFYNTMSFGQLELTGMVLPKRYTSDQAAGSYVSKVPGEHGRFNQFAIEVLPRRGRGCALCPDLS